MRRHLRWIWTLGLVIGSALAGAPAANAYVYWGGDAPAYGTTTGIGRADLDGGNVKPSFIPPTGGPHAQTRGVASDGTYIYFGYEHAEETNQSVPPYIGRAKIDGTDVLRPFSQTTGQAVTGVGVSPTHVYWTNQSQDTSSVGRTPIVGGQQFQAVSSTFGEPNPLSCGVAADDTYMYFANMRTFSIGRAELATMGTPSQVVEGEWIKLPTGVKPCGVAVDGASIYFGIWENPKTSSVDPEGPAGTQVFRADRTTGAGSQLLSAGGNQVSGVAVAGNYVYFSSRGRYTLGAGSVKRVAKDGSGGTLTLVDGLNYTWGVGADLGGAPAAPDVPAPVPVPVPHVNPLSVGCSGCGGGGAPAPPEVRPDFSRVWTTKKSFAPANWNTPLNVAVGSAASRTWASASRTVTAARAAAWAAAPRPTSGSGGTAFNYILAQDATVKIAINAVTSGRVKGKVCKKLTAKSRKKKKCELLQTIATLTRPSRAGTNTVPFSGRINDKALGPGKYRIVFTASAGTLTAEAKSLDITIQPA